MKQSTQSNSRIRDGLFTVLTGTAIVLLSAMLIALYNYHTEMKTQEILQNKRDEQIIEKSKNLRDRLKEHQEQIYLLNYCTAEINVKLKHIVKQQDKIIDKLFPSLGVQEIILK